MSSLSNEERTDIVRDLMQMGSQGRAEGEDVHTLASTFYPVAEHLRMLEPDVVLVVGPRGSGKTEIFRLLTDTDLLDSVVDMAGVRSLPTTNKMEWISGYPLGREGFDASGLRRFLDEHSKDAQAVQELWFAYLVRRLNRHLASKEQLNELLNTQAGAADRVHSAFRAARDEPLLALDELDARLEQEDRYVFIAYDELDILGGSDWDAMAAGVQGLVAFWSAYARRWRRIRPKVFLRTDLFDHFAVSGGADLAKLAAGRVELSWSDRQLYGMLLRRIANTSDRLAEYIRGARSSIDWRSDGKFKLLPNLAKWTDARPVIERMVGPYMGANKNKGLSYRWPLAHVRDGRDRAVPRPLVRLFEEAARSEADNPSALKGMRILAPISLRKAIDRVSREHVDHARDEWKWIGNLANTLESLVVPEDSMKVEKRLRGCNAWESPPPFGDPRELLDYIVEVGILRQRSDGRIDAPDLFLYGLGLKRKGGVRRRWAR